ncbi:FtsB family cell division protein [Mangrovibrevibacter kandeliae]|uniref:FtsB family cell division protein n=1 Tax=Mangrovibrevibacter kandeliae TaxID=2968473 RepID=UPI002118E488|nr:MULTISPECIES: septum formation initiator family protein [unclassified Aurantimonas]MCQ8782594.1 septum formation initiator family protein [Aurantimonas sp. CSK15Z-1]MCW4114597.1 septum formation initiator family protein [Aurantimonas sp. MSK8Z-1]
MWTKQKKNRHTGRLIVPAVAASFLAYFAVHAKSGQYGIEAKAALEQDLATRQASLGRLVKERESLEKRVQLLHDGTLERDMLDEQARRALNMGTEDEIVILR